MFYVNRPFGRLEQNSCEGPRVGSILSLKFLRVQFSKGPILHERNSVPYDWFLRTLIQTMNGLISGTEFISLRLAHLDHEVVLRLEPNSVRKNGSLRIFLRTFGRLERNSVPPCGTVHVLQSARSLRLERNSVPDEHSFIRSFTVRSPFVHCLEWNSVLL